MKLSTIPYSNGELSRIGPIVNSLIKCHCMFAGVTCDREIDECALLKPCQNEATCVDEVARFRCLCPPGWTGEVLHFSLY